jgi:hypothetical protein
MGNDSVTSPAEMCQHGDREMCDESFNHTPLAVLRAALYTLILLTVFLFVSGGK